MKVALYTRGIEAPYKEYFLQLINLLQQNNFSIQCHSLMSSTNNYFDALSQVTYFDSPETIDNDTQFFITLGGDGTILDAVAYTVKKQIPVIGVNFGRLGFLASTGKEDLYNLVQSLVQHTYAIEDRSLLQITSSIPMFGDTPFALNELSLHKTDVSPMIKIHTYINGRFLNTYWCDGLIISTPTGSTGYNLSCNGPIIFPHSNAFAITPVSPHNLNNRPIVIPDDTVITFEVEGRTDNYLCALDARREIVPIQTTIAVRKEPLAFRLLQMPESNFLTTLRNKLGWGMDSRN
jgi:NAD+ kinase